MKKSKLWIVAALAVVFTAVMCSCSRDKSLVGKWIDNETEAAFEYTEDGYYYEYSNENFTDIKTRYSVKNGKITYYLDGDTPESGYSVDYEITEEGNLVIGGEIVYRPLTLPEKDGKK